MKRASWLLLPLSLAAGAGCVLVQMRPSARGPDRLEPAARARVEADVRALAFPRNEAYPEAYAAAAAYVRGAFEGAGYVVRTEPVRPGVDNLVAEVPGAGPGVVVLGAHYDACADAPGADDNASGVAAMLEVARRLAGRPLSRTVRFYAWANEEPPFFQADGMGSRVSAAAARARGEDLVAVLALDSVGFYSDAPGSQAYPAPFGLVMPDRGDFVAVVGNVRSAPLVRDVAGRLRAAGSLKVAASAVPASLPGVDWSDHWSFWQEGYAAVMLTDMPPFRNPHYHEPTDVPDTLDFDRLARFAAALADTVDGLAR